MALLRRQLSDDEIAVLADDLVAGFPLPVDPIDFPGSVDPIDIGVLITKVTDHVRDVTPRQPGDSDFVYRQAIRAKAFDSLRGILPAAAQSNVGIYGTGQGYEQLLLRMRSNPLPEARAYADLMLTELRKVIPSFLKRVDLDDRGVAWSNYFGDSHQAMEEVAARLFPAGTDGSTVTDDKGRFQLRINADGKPDIVWRNSSTGRVILWTMDGATRTATTTIWAAAWTGYESRTTGPVYQTRTHWSTARFSGSARKAAPPIAPQGGGSARGD